MINCKEAREQSKIFHYAWFLLSIILVVGELLEDSQFPSIECDLPEPTKYTSLWATKDAKCIHDAKILWVLMVDMPNSLQSLVDFKVDMPNIYIKVRKDPLQ